MPLEQFPYTNFHELNLDWIIKKIKEAINIENEIKNDLPDIVKNIITEMIDDGSLVLSLSENYDPITEELVLSIIGS